MLLYIHVPFCRQRCDYCSFYSLAAPSAELLKEYTKFILKEMELSKEELGYFELETIFFGGGTPSLLDPEDIEKILNQAAKLFAFKQDMEISLEANPESALRKGWLASVRKLGVNRLSLGVQSFLADELELLGRMHSPMDAENALILTKELDFKCNLDLMSGLPTSNGKIIAPELDLGLKNWGLTSGFELNWSEYQGENLTDDERYFLWRWLWNLEKALAYEPDHLSAYALSLEENTPLTRNKGAYFFPSEEVERELYLKGIELLEYHGLMQYEISNFSKKGSECRHNMGYWQGKEYLGLGPSAVSTLICDAKFERWENPHSYEKWSKALNTGKTLRQKEELSHELLLEEKLLLSLRQAKGLDLREWAKLGGEDLWLKDPLFLKELEDTGLILLSDFHLRLSRQGMLMADSIISHLI